MKRFLLFFALTFGMLVNAQSPIVMGTEYKTPHIKFYILADGYTSTQMSDFDSDADVVRNAIRDLEPYKSNLTKLNFYKIKTVSNQSGQSRAASPGVTAITKDTYWDVFSNSSGIDRLLGIPSSNRTTLENLLKDKSGGNRVFAIIISNDPTYRGFGEFPSYPTWSSSDVSLAIVSADPVYSGFLAIHETGHSFGDLDDEYVDTAYANSGDPFLSHPNRLNIKDSNPGGWLEGGRYVATGKWRYGNGLMRSVAWTFHSRNEDLIQDRIDAEAITIIGTPRTVATNGEHISQVCSAYVTTWQTLYFNTTGIPSAGDYAYTDIHGTSPFNGGNLHYKVEIGSTDWYAKIDQNGKVVLFEECAGGGGGFPK